MAIDEDLIEPLGVPEIYVDNFTKHVSRNGVMSCVGFRDMTEGKVVVVRLVWPLVNTSSAIDDANQAMAAPEPPPPKNRNGSRRRVH